MEIKELLAEVKECEPYTQGIIQIERLVAEIGREYELSIQEKNKDKYERTDSFNTWKNLVKNDEDVEYTEKK